MSEGLLSSCGWKICTTIKDQDKTKQGWLPSDWWSQSCLHLLIATPERERERWFPYLNSFHDQMRVKFVPKFTVYAQILSIQTFHSKLLLVLITIGCNAILSQRIQLEWPGNIFFPEVEPTLKKQLNQIISEPSAHSVPSLSCQSVISHCYVSFIW